MSATGDATSLFGEWALTPGVFEEGAWGAGGSAAQALALELVRLLTLEGGGFVRDLRGGAWVTRVLELCATNDRARRLVTALRQRGRLVTVPGVRAAQPADDLGWCHEACCSHDRNARPIEAVLTMPVTASQIRETAEWRKVTGGLMPDRVASFEELSERTWWRPMEHSVVLPRATDAYLRAVSALLQNARSVQFADPHMEPGRRGYGGEFGRWIQRLADRREPPSEVRVHRVIYRGSSQNRVVLAPAEIRGWFEDALRVVRNRRFEVRLLIWPDFHDRHLLTDVGGVQMSNGFDVSADPTARTTWGRLSNGALDELTKQFDEARLPDRRARTFDL